MKRLTAVALVLTLSFPVTDAGAATSVQLNPLHSAAPAASSPRSSAKHPQAAQLATALRFSVAAARAAVGGATVGGATGSGAGLSAGQRESFADLQAQAAGVVDFRVRPSTGTPLWVRGRALEGAAAGVGGTDNDEATARSFLRKNSRLLRLDDPDTELELRSRSHDGLGRRHLRFAQAYAGIPAWPAEMTVHLDADGNVDVMNGAYVATPRHVATAPAVSAARALEIAHAAASETASGHCETQLIVYTSLDRVPRLAWKLDCATGLASRWIIVVDALDEALLAMIDTVMDENVVGSGVDLFGETQTLNVWQEAGNFFLVDTSKTMFDSTSDPPSPDTTRGAIVVLDAQNRQPDAEGRIDLGLLSSNNANAWPIADGVSAAFGLSETYDYYLARHARDSLDGQGGSMLAVVRFGQGFQNAFWNGTLMVFGDAQPYAGALDVVAHELTHGVTEKSANLVYQNQSGALNEAFSDIFGEAVENRTTNGAHDWLTGAQLGQPLRNMRDPASLPICQGCPNYPSKMSEFFGPNDPFLDQLQNRDNGGVHINSSIINRAFFLLAEGLPGAIGIEPAADIFYRALTVHLVANSQFIDARLAAITAAEELFGQGSAEAQRVAEAFDGVEIVDGAPTPEPPPLPGVQGPDATLFAYFDPLASDLFLARREEGDDPLGFPLSLFGILPTRAAVVGDGSFAAFVDAFNDLCLISTSGQEFEVCLGLPGLVGSVAVTPDASRFGFVLLDELGAPQNVITVVDPDTEDLADFPLRSPVLDGSGINTVLFADALDFTADGRFIVYDAFNQIDIGTTTLGLWSIYALDLLADTTLSLVAPTPGFDIGFPALGQRNDHLITFDAFDQTRQVSTVLAGNLITGETAPIAEVDGRFGVPGFNGDDTAIVYSQVDDGALIGASLVRQQLGADLAPIGAPTLWLEDADFGVIYRRGIFTAPQSTATPTTLPTRTATRTASPSASPTRTPSPGLPTDPPATATFTPTPSPSESVVPSTPTATADAATPTVTGEFVNPPTETATPRVDSTATATVTRSTTPAGGDCAGDCDGNGQVRVDELLLAIAIALGDDDPTSCRRVDLDRDGEVLVHELVHARHGLLRGCD